MTGLPEHPSFHEYRSPLPASHILSTASPLKGEKEIEELEGFKGFKGLKALDGLEEIIEIKVKKEAQEIPPSPSSFWKTMVFLSLPSLVLLTLVLSWVVVGINGSQSLPYGIFLCLRDQAFEKGDLVLIEDHQTRYFQDLPYVKRLVAQAGDPIPDLSRKTYTKTGQPLSRLPFKRVPAGFVFVQGDHPDSFDSRYEEFGLVHEKHLKARCIGLGTESFGLGNVSKTDSTFPQETSQRANLESELFGWGRPLP